MSLSLHLARKYADKIQDDFSAVPQDIDFREQLVGLLVTCIDEAFDEAIAAAKHAPSEGVSPVNAISKLQEY